MPLSANETYLETQILTATPQRLRLLLIEGALRRARAAQAAWQADNVADGLQAISQCRDIVAELIGGIQPDQSPLAKQVLGIYMFLFSTLIEAQFARDTERLSDIIRVLDEERQTWLAVCEQMPNRPTAITTSPEELAPPQVTDAWTPGYGHPTSNICRRTASEFSMEA